MPCVLLQRVSLALRAVVRNHSAVLVGVEEPMRAGGQQASLPTAKHDCAQHHLDWRHLKSSGVDATTCASRSNRLHMFA